MLIQIHMDFIEEPDMSHRRKARGRSFFYIKSLSTYKKNPRGLNQTIYWTVKYAAQWTELTWSP